MKFIIENIGSIEKAEVELNGLSVICGENNSGKTTIAKIIYAVGQASSFFATDYQLQKYDRILDMYSELSFYIDEISYAKIKINIEITDIIENLQNKIFHFRRTADFKEADIILTSSLIRKLYNLLEIEELNEDQKNTFKKILSLESKLSKEYINLEKQPIQDFIFEALKSEFSNDLLYKKEGVDRAVLSFYDNEEEISILEFNNKRVLNHEILTKLPIQDSTLIDGPYVFQISSIIHNLTMMNSLRRGRKSNMELKLPYHLIDLCSKIDGSKNFKNKANSECDWSSNDFYEGIMGFNTKNGNFELSQNEKSYIANNVSSGMKSIGIIDLLYKGRFINKDSILIIDEPETNLHPKWQRLYAKSIVDLAKQGTKILINTHSPYMLESLKIYSVKQKLKDTKFYFTSKQEGEVLVNDTNGNIIPIIEALSEPLYTLMEEQEDVSDF